MYIWARWSWPWKSPFRLEENNYFDGLKPSLSVPRYSRQCSDNDCYWTLYCKRQVNVWKDKTIILRHGRLLTVDSYAMPTSGRHTRGWCTNRSDVNCQHSSLVLTQVYTVNRKSLSNVHPPLLLFNFIELYLFAKGESSHALYEAWLYLFPPNAWSSKSQNHWYQHPVTNVWNRHECRRL